MGMKRLVAVLALGISLSSFAGLSVRSNWTCTIRCNQGGGGYSPVALVVTDGNFAPTKAQVQTLSNQYCSEQDGVSDIECDFSSGKLTFTPLIEYTVVVPVIAPPEQPGQTGQGGQTNPLRGPQP